MNIPIAASARTAGGKRAPGGAGGGGAREEDHADEEGSKGARGVEHPRLACPLAARRELRRRPLAKAVRMLQAHGRIPLPE